MTEDAPEAPQKKRGRKWLRRIGWTLLALFLLFVVFHRPILIALIHTIAIKIAAKQHIVLSLEVSGTVFADLSLKNIHAVPSGNGPSPVSRITIDEVSVSYSIVSLIRRGPSEFLKRYSLRNADIEVKPVEGTKQQKHDLASTLHDMIQNPALFSDSVDVDNLNLVAHTPDGDFALTGVKIFLDPVRTGEVRIAKLQIPKIRTWENLAATATYAHRDLVLSGLTLDPEIVINRVELDASQRAQGINRLALSGSLFGGDADFSMWMHELAKKKNAPNSADVKIDSRLQNLSLEKLSAYFNASTPAIGTVSDATITLTGNPNVPATWTGSLISKVGAVHAGSATLERASARIDAKGGTAVFNAELNSGRNGASVQAQCALPRSVDAFTAMGVEGTMSVKVEDLNQFAAEITQGTLSGNGTFSMGHKVFTAKLSGAATQVDSPQFGLANGTLALELSKNLAVRTNPPTPFDGLRSHLTANFTDIRAADYALDSGALELSVEEAQVHLAQLVFARGENSVTASGACILPRDMKSFATMPGSAKFALRVPNAATFRAEPDLRSPNAQAEMSGTISNGPDGYDGKIEGAISNITYREFAARNLTLSVTIAHSVASIDTLEFSLNETDGMTGSGHAELRPPYIYDGRLQASVRDLSRFNSLMQNAAGGIGGSISLDWTGSGRASELQHSGDVRLRVSNAKAPGVTAINVGVEGSYSPELIDLPTFWITSSKGGLSAMIGLKENVLTIGNIVAKQGNKPVLGGSISLPLDLRTPKDPETIIPLNGPVAINLTSTELALEGFFPKDTAPIKGVAKATLAASGSVEQLDARLELAVRNLQAKAAPKLAPTTVDLDMRLVQDELSLKGRIVQPAIQAIEIAGTLPMPLKQIVKQKKVDENSPVQLSVRLPKSSVAFVSQITPAVRYVEGTASINADVAGTIAQPEFSGSALLDLPAVRLANQDMPAISGFRGDVRFEKNQLTVNKLGGDISGGSVNVTGAVNFPKLTEPEINLRLVSDGALLVRNESLTVRADSDVRVTGPLKAATVVGTIGITRSKFFREIEILPIELPGRPAPKPPETTPGFSIDKPPLRDWKFDVAIKTKDPFAVRGNLANGAVAIDLALVGTGRAPTLDGSVRIENFVASLPFSKLEVRYGYVYFSPDEPFIPRLDIQGTSSMRDYNINAYIFGTANEPQTVFSSEPPLPQEDIIALLATGSTASELTGSGDALAGRGAALLFQRLYRKVFKAKEPSENESFLSRFNVDVGGVDPRTGQQEVSTRFKLGENFYLIGDLDVGGNIRGQVKYLLRFR
ncbi:MAG: translocation and assembly module TamB [Chthoniobacter sp.]|nr:translocation and assembly module TamB [Chthoniobacter sp.]